MILSRSEKGIDELIKCYKNREEYNKTFELYKKENELMFEPNKLKKFYDYFVVIPNLPNDISKIIYWKCDSGTKNKLIITSKKTYEEFRESVKLYDNMDNFLKNVKIKVNCEIFSKKMENILLKDGLSSVMVLYEKLIVVEYMKLLIINNYFPKFDELFHRYKQIKKVLSSNDNVYLIHFIENINMLKQINLFIDFTTDRLNFSDAIFEFIFYVASQNKFMMKNKEYIKHYLKQYESWDIGHKINYDKYFH